MRVFSKYDSDADVYQLYEIKGENVSFEKRYLKARNIKPLIKWTHTLEELGWTSMDRYIAHLKSLKFKEVKPYEGRRQSKACAVS